MIQDLVVLMHRLKANAFSLQWIDRIACLHLWQCSQGFIGCMRFIFIRSGVSFEGNLSCHCKSHIIRQVSALWQQKLMALPM